MPFRAARLLCLGRRDAAFPCSWGAASPCLGCRMLLRALLVLMCEKILSPLRMLAISGVKASLCFPLELVCGQPSVQPTPVRDEQ